MRINLFPMKLPDGRIVINERCTCGHLRTQHRGLIHHGPCVEGLACGCDKFSWADWVLLDEPTN